MTTTLRWLWEHVALWQIYFSSASFYLSVVNFILIIATFKKAYDIHVSIFLFVPAALFSMMLIGWVHYRLLLRPSQEHMNRKNDLKDQLNRIEEAMKR